MLEYNVSLLSINRLMQKIVQQDPSHSGNRHGRVQTDLDRTIRVCFSSDHSDPENPPEDQRSGRGGVHYGGPKLTHHDVVLVPSSFADGYAHSCVVSDGDRPSVTKAPGSRFTVTRKKQAMHCEASYTINRFPGSIDHCQTCFQDMCCNLQWH